MIRVELNHKGNNFLNVNFFHLQDLNLRSYLKKNAKLLKLINVDIQI